MAAASRGGVPAKLAPKVPFRLSRTTRPLRTWALSDLHVSHPESRPRPVRRDAVVRRGTAVS